MERKWLCVLSGGQDSTTALYWARRHLGHFGYALTFEYGQSHAEEVTAARLIAQQAGADGEVVRVPVLSDSSLNSKSEERYLGLPDTFLPGRNLLFLVLAAQRAFKLGVHHVVTGVCQTDFSGYPDCRRSFVDSLQQTLALAMEWPVQIHTPLMHLTKAQTVQLAVELDCMDAIAGTITCYRGYGCGKCEACKLRARGFKEAGIEDPSFQKR